MTLNISKEALESLKGEPDQVELLRAQAVLSQARLLLSSRIDEGKPELFKAWGQKKDAHTFFTLLLGQMRQRWTDEVAVAQVTYSPETPRGALALNPKTVQNMKAWELASTLVHEVYHVILEHLWSNDRTKKDPKLAGIAMDVATNQKVQELTYKLMPAGRQGLVPTDPSIAVSPVDFNRFKDFARAMGLGEPKPGMNWEYYYDFAIQALQQEDQAQGQGQGESEGDGEGEGEGDSEGEGQAGNGKPNKPGKGKSKGQKAFDDLAKDTDHGFDSGDGTEGEARKRLVAEAVQGAMDECQAEGGQLPGNMRAEIENLVKILRPPVVLENLLPEILAGCGTETAYVSRTRFNRHGLLGRMAFRPGSSVGIVIDTSGSVSDTEFGRAIGIIEDYRARTGTAVYVQQCSYGETVEIYELPEGLKAEEIHGRCGYGGTFMKPGIEAFLRQNNEIGEYEVGGIIVITDGELAWESEAVRKEDVDIPIVYLCSRKVQAFRDGSDAAGKVYYYDPKDGQVECLFS